MRVDRRIKFAWTGKILNPERKSCGFKNIRIRVDGASVHSNHQATVGSEINTDIDERRLQSSIAKFFSRSRFIFSQENTNL